MIRFTLLFFVQLLNCDTCGKRLLCLPITGAKQTSVACRYFKAKSYSVRYLSLKSACSHSGPPRGGAGGTMTPGPMGIRKAVGFSEPIEMTLRNQNMRLEELFFFGYHQISTGKTVKFSVKTFFFGDHLILTRKTVRMFVLEISS